MNSTLYALRSDDGRLWRTVSSNDDRWIYFLCSILPFDGKDITEAWTEASLVRYTMLALVMYIGVLVLLLLWKQGFRHLT